MFNKCSIDQKELEEAIISSLRSTVLKVLSDTVRTSVVSAFTGRDTAGLSEFDNSTKQLAKQLEQLAQLLNRHLQVARLRFELEKSDRGAYNSLREGLKHMQTKTTSKEFEGLSRKLKSLLSELDFLDKKIMLDSVIVVQGRLIERYEGEETKETGITRV